MKHLYRALTAALFLAGLVRAQTTPPPPTRTVTLTWSASTTAGVAGYIVSSGPSSTGSWTQLGCVGTALDPNTSAPLTCVSGSTAATTTYTDTEPVGSTVWYTVITAAGACSPTSSTSAACGYSAPATPTSTTVPPKPAAVTTVVVTVK